MTSLALSVSCLTVVLAAGREPTLLDLGAGLTLELVHVEPGAFTQGSPAQEPGREPDEVPRQVRVTRGFALGKAPVSFAAYERFVAERQYLTEAERGSSGGYGVEGGKLVQRKEYTWRNPGFPQAQQDPVVLVTHADAVAFTAWLSQKTGRTVRLPSEAEWELAARSGLPFVDLTGRVNQWCDDWYTVWDGQAVVDPRVTTESKLPGQPARRVLKGGSSLKDPRWSRIAARTRQTPGSRNADNGFRVLVEEGPPVPSPLAGAVVASDAVVRNEAGGDEGAGQAGSFAFELSGDGAAPAQSSRCGGTAVLAFLVAAWLWGRRAVRALWKLVFPGPVRLETDHEGVWLESALPPGTWVTLRYRSQGKPQTRAVELEGRRTYLFTGLRPGDVEVVETRPPGSGPPPSGPSRRRRGGADEEPEDTSSSDTSSRGGWSSPGAY